MEALDPARFEPLLVGLETGGTWRLQDRAVLDAASGDPRGLRLDPGGKVVRLSLQPGASGSACFEVEGEEPVSVDVAFPVLHGPFGEDGCVQGLFELASLPYVGSGVLGSALGMDKDVMKRLLAQAELPLCPWVTIRRGAWERTREAALEEARALAAGSDAFVKPANLGSSVGISRAGSNELANAIDLAFEFDDKVVVERAAGPRPVRELEVAVLGSDDPEASVPGEISIEHPDGFYSYAAKYVDAAGVTARIPADLPPARTNAVQLLALRTFRALEAEGLARVDFLLTADGELFVNEINTLPGFTAISMYPKLWEASGLPPRALVSRLLDLALERGARRRRLRTRA